MQWRLPLCAVNLGNLIAVAWGTCPKDAVIHLISRNALGLGGHPVAQHMTVSVQDHSAKHSHVLRIFIFLQIVMVLCVFQQLVCTTEPNLYFQKAATPQLVQLVCSAVTLGLRFASGL